MRWIGYVATILWWSGIARSLSTLNRGHSYKISPKPCKVPGPSGGEGTCMFVWECINSEGTHVGVCVDTFMFGSCCVHNSTSNTIHQQQNNKHHSQKQQHRPSHQRPNHAAAGSSSNTLRPPITEALENESTRLTLTSSHVESSTSRPTIGQHSSSSSSSFSVPLLSPPSASSSHSAHNGGPIASSTRPLKPLNGVRPLQKRPHVKPTSVNQDDKSQQQTSSMMSPSSSSSSIWHENTSQGTRMPSSSQQHSLSKQKTRPDIVVSTPNQVNYKNPSPLDDDHKLHQGFKDKIDNGHNTLVIRLPGKEHVSNEQRPIRPPRPNSQVNEEGKTEHAADLTGQETIHRPNVNSVNDDGAIKDSHPHLNYIHTERPQWATKPITSNKPSIDYSKPYFSIKTTTHRSTNVQPDVRPNFISKPETNVKLSTTSRPNYYSSQSTSAAGSAPQTAHWQVTTEPAFITRQRPSSSSKPLATLITIKPSSSSSSLPFSNGHVWSENSWTPPKSSLKPHWTDNPSLTYDAPESFPQRPSLKPTEPQQNEYQKPLGSAHYITTSHFETSTKSKPTKKTSPTSTTTSTTTTTIPPSTTMTTTTTTTTTTSTTSTTTTTTTQRPPSTSTEIGGGGSSSSTKTGSIMTVPAAAESRNMQCGVPPLFPRPETRIVGGKDAPFGRWPWQVSVRRTSFFGFSSTHRCGGAVLNENWIATAGHCVDDLLTSQIRIRVGEYDFSSIQERLPHVERGVAKKVVHPKYNFFTYEYDLALVKLESSLTFAPHISPICLPASDELLIGENATVTGWGRLSEGGTLPSVLQEVSVPIVSNDRCKSMFLKAGRHEFIPEIFLCAGYETGGQDSCQGDSGGPLQVRGKDGRYFLAGIISWGIGCAEANLPGVCTRISKFVPWILKNVT